MAALKEAAIQAFTRVEHRLRMEFMGKRILIVDDSSIMRRMLREVLTAGDHEIVGEAKSGDEAISLFVSLKPDIVTMDITMRGMDGFEAARRIYELDSKARIIFLSNLNDEKYATEASSLGAIGYVNKHESKQLLSLINTF